MDDLTIYHLNGQNFEELIEDLVLKTDLNLTLESQKVFEQGFGTNVLLTDYINENNVEDLLLKSSNLEIIPTVIVHGNVWIENNLTTNSINNVPLSQLNDLFSYNDNFYTINNDVEFDKDVTIDRLYTKGLLNNMAIKEYFENVMDKSESILNRNITFKNRVIIKKNLHVKSTINGYDFDQIINEMVLTTDDSKVEEQIIFSKDVYADSIDFQNLQTEFLTGCNLKDWKENAVYLHDGKQTGRLAFDRVILPETSEFIVDYINEVDMNNVIPLNVNRTIDEHLSFNSITFENDIDVGNLVNGIDLPSEFHNTVMKDINQVIETHVIFTGSVSITKGLKISGLINGKNLSQLVTTNTDQKLGASYIFDGKTTIDSDLYLMGHLNEINLTIWDNRKITVSKPDQVITNPMSVHGNLTFEAEVNGGGRLGGWNVSVVADLLETKMIKKLGIEEASKEEYKDMCYKLHGYIDRANNQIYKFKYLENHQNMELQHVIHAMHNFEVC